MLKCTCAQCKYATDLSAPRDIGTRIGQPGQLASAPIFRLYKFYKWSVCRIIAEVAPNSIAAGTSIAWCKPVLFQPRSLKLHLERQMQAVNVASGSNMEQMSGYFATLL